MNQIPSSGVRRIRRLPVRRPRSLLVEDDITQLERRRELLRFRNVDVISATSRQEALSRLRSLQFTVDVAVVDLNLEPESAELGGVAVAEAIGDNSGGSVPVYAYSGKTSSLDPEQRRHFKRVALKSSSSRLSRKLLNDAAMEARGHFEARAARGVGVAARLSSGPKALDRPDVDLLRDLLAGSLTLLEPRRRNPEAVGVLALDEVGVPYALESLSGQGEERILASVLGHEYIYGLGANGDEAAKLVWKRLWRAT